MSEAAVSLFGIDILDCEDVDLTEESIQYNNVTFYIESLKQYEGCTIEVKSDWTMIIWGEEGTVIHQFSLIENDEFRQTLYDKYPR
ncbi:MULTISPECIES: hypothetical protein [Paenibacillus]|uniref:hypothetical protein n=1 Tax=Paenibacillus TaxID=44249 RepID=UPI00089434FA|nr:MULTISPECIES: hypothetical protein [Paenibacillus]MCZ1267412.1 hypothetical protein [Paenibacillus tundrae]SEB27478.1 hypothetical protein SAMN03159332_6138 [Paenibacillus sp. 276b]SLK16751.1 hypothetical protein SAMN06272722_110239 [Paenibacillus sp. RU5A]SOC74453.1 hypothetical protein SAMN05880581_110239 [Paenibacillus sp. RU26A]SOC76640.1 hypothetical protein SAMN05880586_110239 [Paenibacillus sp. RU5M]